MKQQHKFNPLQILIFFGLMSANFIMTSNSVLAQNVDKPSTKLKVERKSGNCPSNVVLWWMLLGFEGGADHIVVADTRPIANDAKVIKSQQQLVE